MLTYVGTDQAVISYSVTFFLWVLHSIWRSIYTTCVERTWTMISLACCIDS